MNMKLKKMKRKEIYLVLRSEYLQQFLNDIRNEMIYKRSSQFVNDKLAKQKILELQINYSSASF